MSKYQVIRPLRLHSDFHAEQSGLNLVMFIREPQRQRFMVKMKVVGDRISFFSKG